MFSLKKLSVEELARPPSPCELSVSYFFPLVKYLFEKSLGKWEKHPE